MKLAASKATTAKILASVVLVGGAASVAGLGTFGAFTSTTTANQAVGTGTVKLGLDKSGTQGIEVAAANMVPGDKIQRSVTLTRTGSEQFGTVTLTTTSNGTILTTGHTNSMTLSIDSCSTAWTVNATTKDMTCTGAVSVLSGNVVGANRELTGVATTLNGGKAANLRVTLTLPSAADNDFQGLGDSVKFDFTATQRAEQKL